MELDLSINYNCLELPIFLKNEVVGMIYMIISGNEIVSSMGADNSFASLLVNYPDGDYIIIFN